MDRLNGNGEILSQVSLGDVQNHSSFDRRNHNFLSGKLGKLIPTRLDEVYPGDRIKGRIQSVINFEPLVSPILGNMVLKQESFYIPWHILWKNAYKFVTGKNEFNGTKPKVSPLTIFNTYNQSLFYSNLSAFTAVKILRTLYSYAESTSTVDIDYNSFLSSLSSEDIDFSIAADGITAFANQFQVLDLFQPYLDLIHDYFSFSSHDPFVSKMNSAFTGMMQADIDDRAPYFDKCIRYLSEFYYKLYEGLFGLSSLLDYIGYPVFDDWQKYWITDFYNLRYKLIEEEPVLDNLNWSADPDDYFSNIAFDWLPFRAYYVVWYWNYRDELLETSALDPESDTFLADTVGGTEIILCTLLRVRCWYKDTFTTALTNTGDGNLSVPVSFGENTSDIEYKYFDPDGSILENTSDFESAYQSGATICEITCGGVKYRVPMNYFASSFNPTDSYLSSNSSALMLSLDLFDRVTRLRKFIQKKLVLGYEYDDVVWSSFLVKLSNVRMRIPEILARGRDVVDINTLVNNTSTNEQAAGDKSAIAWVNGSTSDMNYFAEEHGFYLSIMTVLPLQSYAGGMQRLWSKLEQFDIMWPEFASMGMDAVYNFELAAPRGMKSLSGLSDEAAMQVFGYQGRYFDLKTRLDEEHGRLRSDLNFLTFSREFNNEYLPKLNYIFVHCWPQTDMFVLDDSNEDVFRADVYSALDWQRRLPVPAEYV